VGLAHVEYQALVPYQLDPINSIVFLPLPTRHLILLPLPIRLLAYWVTFSLRPFVIFAQLNDAFCAQFFEEVIGSGDTFSVGGDASAEEGSFELLYLTMQQSAILPAKLRHHKTLVHKEENREYKAQRHLNLLPNTPFFIVEFVLAAAAALLA
jgi:hypothetical protein